MLFKPTQGSICIYGAPIGKNAFIKLCHGMVLRIAVSLFRLPACQSQHDRGYFLTYISKILRPSRFRASSAAFCCIERSDGQRFFFSEQFLKVNIYAFG